MAVDILGNGWNISQQGEEIITENNTIKDKNTVLKNALNSDLKEIGSPVLSKITTKGNVSQVVLQIQKIRNISAPKANENSQAAPRMLKLVLTDGDTYIQAVEVAPISFINYEKTPPGSKLLILSAKISSGYLLLDSTNCSLLGGQVPTLYEKWQLAKSVQCHNRQNSSSDGPPAWVNFGCKIQTQPQDKNFKSLDNKAQEVKENDKFELQRQDAIAEAASGAVKKVFGGGVKQSIQQPLSQINKKNEAYSKERRVHKAKVSSVKEVDEKPQKPCERVSLFDFLENKLPTNETLTNPTQNEPAPKPNAYNNNLTAQQNNRYKSGCSVKSNNRLEYSQTNAHNRLKREERSQTSQRKIETNNDVKNLSNSIEKMSLNSQFASRSLRQHLNLGEQRKNEAEDLTNVNWKVGDECMAKYWEDGKYYNAVITAVTDRTCVVQFKGYGNIEEVLKVDCLPKSGNETNKKAYTGPMEFRRNTRVYKRQ